jgi:hypothetical protein
MHTYVTGDSGAHGDEVDSKKGDNSRPVHVWLAAADAGLPCKC